MAALSHDARTPLNAVVLSAKLLESQARGQDDPEVDECLRTIRNSVFSRASRWIIETKLFRRKP